MTPELDEQADIIYGFWVHWLSLSLGFEVDLDSGHMSLHLAFITFFVVWGDKGIQEFIEEHEEQDHE